MRGARAHRQTLTMSLMRDMVIDMPTNKPPRRPIEHLEEKFLYRDLDLRIEPAVNLGKRKLAGTGKIRRARRPQPPPERR